MATESQRSVKARKGNGGQGATQPAKAERLVKVAEERGTKLLARKGTLTTVHQNVSHTVTIRLHELTASDRDRWLE